MKKKSKKPIANPPKSTVEKMEKEFIATCTFGEKLLLLTYTVQLKVKDGNYYKSDKDYSFWLRLNPFHPFSYLLIIYIILKGIFTRKLDYEEFWHNITTIFYWQEEEL